MKWWQRRGKHEQLPPDDDDRERAREYELALIRLRALEAQIKLWRVRHQR